MAFFRLFISGFPRRVRRWGGGLWEGWGRRSPPRALNIKEGIDILSE